MRSLASKLVVLGVSLSLFVPSAIAGCATSDPLTDDSTDDTGATTTTKKDAGKVAKKDSGKAKSTDDTAADDDDTTPTDSGSTDSGVKDSGKDASTSKDAGTWPAEGASCTTAGELAQKPCGMCGVAKTFCGGTAGALTWQPYGFCDQPADAECTPGTNDTGSCGNCGTQTRVCQSNCHYQLGACSEPAGACTPGLRTFTVGLSCPVGPSSGRESVCDNTCKWGLPSDCTYRATSLTIASTAGATVNNEFTLTPLTTQIGAIYFAEDCPDGYVFDGYDRSYAYVKLTNGTAKTAKVSVWSGPAATGPTMITHMAIYNRTTAPVIDSDREMCLVRNDGCSTSPCDSGGNWAGLVNADAITLSAGASVMVYIEPDDETTTGAFQLWARTDSLN